MDYSFITSLTVNIASFSIGTAFSWSSPMTEKLLNNSTDDSTAFKITEEEGSWISAALSGGAAVGPFIFGNLSDRLGRKLTLLGTGIPLIIGYLILAITKSAESFYFGRFLCGLSVGGIFNVLPVYIGEIANNYNRGALSSLLTLYSCAGMLFSYCVGPYVSVMMFNLTLAVFPIIFIVLFAITGPESAYYYIQKEDHVLAMEALQKVRGASALVKKELEMIHDQIRDVGQGTFFDIFKTQEMRRGFLITIVLVTAQQLSGIMAVLYYSQTIFTQAGVNLDPAICSIIVGLVQFLTTFITPLLVDKSGRKILLLTSAFGMVLSEAPLGAYSFFRDNDYDVSYMSALPIICLIVYIISFNIGFGSLPWVIMGELFPTNVKSSATLFTTSFCYSLAFLVAKYFHAVVATIGMGPAFWIFTISCSLSIPFIYFVVIETKGKSLYEIQQELS